MTKEQREREARRAALTRLSPESLIKRYIRRCETAAAAAIEMAEIEMALAAKFSGDKAADKIVTASGVAEYKRSTTYSIIDAHVDDIRAALGLDFSEIVEEKQKHTVPKDRMHELVEFLGSDIDRFVKTETSYGFTKLGSTRISRDDNDLHARIEGWYTVTPKVSVKVTPAT